MNLAHELANLERLTIPDLRIRYAELFGDGTNANNKAWLVKRIAWRLQANAEGGLSERARQRAAELANDADLRLAPPKEHAPIVRTALPTERDPRLPRPGTVLTRTYKRTELQVKVLDDGFEYAGNAYTSLSAVAKAITGAHVNGFHFFRLTEGSKA